MSSLPDLEAATGQAETRDLYREMVDLERRSTFAFQGSRWLSDIAPLLLGAPLCDSLAIAKEKACPLILARLFVRPASACRRRPCRRRRRNLENAG